LFAIQPEVHIVDAIFFRVDNMHFPIDDVDKLKVLEAEFMPVAVAWSCVSALAARL
jgi:hypothetical protein